MLTPSSSVPPKSGCRWRGAAVVDVADEPGRARHRPARRTRRRSTSWSPARAAPGAGRPASRRGGIDCAAAAPRREDSRERREKNSRPPCQRFHVCGSSGNDYGADLACNTPDRPDSDTARGADLSLFGPAGQSPGARENRTLAGIVTRKSKGPVTHVTASPKARPYNSAHSHNLHVFGGCQKGHMPMRERPSPRTPFSTLFTRDAARRGGVSRDPRTRVRGHGLRRDERDAVPGRLHVRRLRARRAAARRSTSSATSSRPAPPPRSAASASARSSRARRASA